MYCNYIKIGKYKLLNYNADNELYQINIEIEKKDEQILNYEFDKLTNLHQLTFAMGEAIAHLNHLWREGILRRKVSSDGVTRFFC